MGMNGYLEDLEKEKEKLEEEKFLLERRIAIAKKMDEEILRVYTQKELSILFAMLRENLNGED